ncbi:MAG: hypothetical protein JXR96_29765 [Deltaproteobacteria bacterium]|nr:hypothetical protein [Deltaproteobacteria bacterium]
MARPIVIAYDGQQAQFDHRKIDRSKLYGQRKRIPLDPEGAPCQRAELTGDGAVLIRPGMTAQGYFDEQNRWIASRVLVGLDAEGKVLPRVESTLGAAQQARAAKPEELLDFRPSSVYQLEPVELPDAIAKALESGTVLAFDFNYRGDFHAERAFLLGNEEGLFALVGNPVEPAWLGLEQAIDGSLAEGEPEDGELDFEMF